MPPRAIKYQLSCPFEITSGSFLIGRRSILVIPTNHLVLVYCSINCATKPMGTMHEWLPAWMGHDIHVPTCKHYKLHLIGCMTPFNTLYQPAESQLDLQCEPTVSLNNELQQHYVHTTQLVSIQHFETARWIFLWYGLHGTSNPTLARVFHTSGACVGIDYYHWYILPNKKQIMNLVLK